jgi:hypothetical protein
VRDAVAAVDVNAIKRYQPSQSKAHELLRRTTAGKRADLRRRDVCPQRVSHTRQSMDDNGLPHEQTNCGLKDDEVRGPANQPKGHNQCRRSRRRMRNIQENHQRSGRGKGERRGQDPGPAQFRDEGRPGMMQSCDPQRCVTAGDTNGVTAQRVPRACRRSRRREEQQERGGPERGKNERGPEDHRQSAEDADTNEAVDEHEQRPLPGQPRSANHVRPHLLLSCLGQQVFQCVSSREDLLELCFGDSEERSLLTRAKARVAPAGAAGQQRLLAHVVELLNMRQDYFVTVSIDGEDLHRTPDDNVSAVACFALSEDERRGRELDDLGDLGKPAELAGIEIAEQSKALEELLAFRRNHDLFRVTGSIKGQQQSNAGRDRTQFAVLIWHVLHLGGFSH